MMRRGTFHLSLRPPAGLGLLVASTLVIVAIHAVANAAAEGSPLPASVLELRAACDSTPEARPSRSRVISSPWGRQGYWTRWEAYTPAPGSFSALSTYPSEGWRFVEFDDSDSLLPPDTPPPALPRRSSLPIPSDALGLPVLRSPSAPGTFATRRGSSGVFDHFAEEPFLSQLSLRLRRSALGSGLRREIEDYLLERESLTLELLAQLAASGASGDPTPWRALAARQEPRLVALERSAEELRRKLRRGTLSLGEAFDPLANRSWRIDREELARPRSELAGKEAQLARASAYAAEGFSPRQRRLLLEAGEELVNPLLRSRGGGVEAVIPGTVVNPRARRLVVGFMPEQVVVELGPPLASEVADELVAIDALKRTLKQELLDAVYFNDRYSESTRREAFSRLAATQESRLNELERRAEAVRPALAICFELPPGAAEPEIPPVLRDRIERHRATKRDLQTELRRNTSSVARAPEPPRVFRLHTSQLALQSEQILAVLAQFQGRRTPELLRLAAGGDGAAELDRRLGAELRKSLREFWPSDGEIRFQYSCDRAATTDAKRAEVRERFPAVWAKRRELTEPIEREARRLAAELQREDVVGVENLLRRAHSHWFMVEWTARELSADLGLTPPRESENDYQKRRSQALADAARLQEGRMKELSDEEAAIRAELAKSAGGANLARRSLDDLLFENRRRLRAERDLLEQRVYRAAVVTPGMSPAQRRLLLGVAVVNHRRNSTPQLEEKTVTR